jgi:hypothetical protein
MVRIVVGTIAFLSCVLFEKVQIFDVLKVVFIIL